MTVGHPLRRVFVCLFAVCTIAGLCAAAGNWPRFRGPNGSATADPKAAETIPVTWTDADCNWKIKLPAGSYSSPVIWGDRVFLTCANEKTALRIVCCVSAKDGKVPLGERTSATPATVGGVMYIRTFSHLMSLGGKGK